MKKLASKISDFLDTDKGYYIGMACFYFVLFAFAVLCGFVFSRFIL